MPLLLNQKLSKFASLMSVGVACLLLSSLVRAEIVFVKQNSAPKYFDRGSEYTGLCDAIYINMQLRLQEQGVAVKVEPDLYPIKRVLALLSAGAGHVFCGAGRNQEREEKYIYSKDPVYAVSNVVLMHQDNNYVASSYQDLQDNKLKIGAYYGTSSARFLKKFEGVHVVDSFKTLDSAMEAVASKVIPYFYYHDLGLNYLVRKSTLPIKVMPTKFRTVDQWMLYSKHLSPEQIALLDAELRNLIEEGVLAQIHSQYF